MLSTGNLTLNHVIAYRAEVDADRIGVIFEGADGRWSELSYGDLYDRSAHLAGGLARAEAYAIVPADVDSVREGDPVDVMVVA